MPEGLIAGAFLLGGCALVVALRALLEVRRVIQVPPDRTEAEMRDKAELRAEAGLPAEGPPPFRSAFAEEQDQPFTFAAARRHRKAS